MPQTACLTMTAAQALTRFLCAQFVEIDGVRLPVFAGVWAIFGHGNVAGLGEALYGVRDQLPTFRAHNEQAMAHAAIAFAKASQRRRMMACTTSIGPGATNMVTAAAVAHVNRLPVLLLPGDVFASRLPDPVLQQIEDFGDGTVSANDCFRSVSRYFDRITRPEQLLAALPRAMQVLTDAANCGPVTLSLCQDVQAEAYAFPAAFFAARVWHQRRPRPDLDELARATALVGAARQPLIIAGGGVHYAQACDALATFARRHNIGGIGVTGTDVANTLAANADLVLAIGTRLQDFTTGSRSLFQNPGMRLIGLNVEPADAGKHGGVALVSDARTGLTELSGGLGPWSAPAAWAGKLIAAQAAWAPKAAAALAADQPPEQPAITALPTDAPTDAQVIGAVHRACTEHAIIVGAAGGLPGELHKLWLTKQTGTYHMEYGYSCMGYEIAGGLGVKMAKPDSDVIVMVGDGSYLMMNSEIATSVAMGLRLLIILLDNRGFGCINRLQRATGIAPFNNLLAEQHPVTDFAMHAASLGAIAMTASSLTELETHVRSARNNERTTVIVIKTKAGHSTAAGGHWWDVAVPAASEHADVRSAHAAYLAAKTKQRLG
jgi:3D-(3,5/4)-trihydroxycyclohexane-1,2-dione acylhydrolase (decyclizing)